MSGSARPAAGGSLAVAPTSRTVFSRPGVQAMYLVIIVLIVPTLLFGGLLHGVARPVQIAAWLALLCCQGLAAWRLLQLAVVATPDSVIIRNIRNTHRIPWREVEEIFEPGPVPTAVYVDNPLATPKVGLFVRLQEGAIISCTVYSGAFWTSGWYGNDNAIQRAVSGLNELLGQYTGGSGPSSDVADSPPDLLS